LPRGSVVVDVGGGIGSTSMLLASAFSPNSSGGEDLGLRFVVQDRAVVVDMGEKVFIRFLFCSRWVSVLTSSFRMNRRGRRSVRSCWRVGLRNSKVRYDFTVHTNR
jgi:hypothetical protein